MSGQPTVSGVLSKLLSRRGSAAAEGSSRDDRYAAREMISPAQMRLYHYLQDAFPAQAVLFAQPLSQLVSVRHASNRQRAAERLEEMEVDFVVSDANGKPLIAFQIDAFRPNESDESQRREAAVKHRVLDTAGIRLLRLKTTMSNLPTTDVFRERVDALLSGESRPSPRAGPPSGMTMTDLMGLPTQTPVEE
jgi:hypothetical protein